MKKPNAYTVYLISQGASSLFFSMIFTVNLVYQATMAHLNPLQLVLVGTVLETTAFLFEIPTGVVADVYGRRLSIIIGLFLIGLGFVVEGSIPRFETILLAQVLWGIGYTFTSGATEAWISDEIGEANVGRAYLRAAQFGQISDLIGIGASVMLASIRINLPIVLGGVLLSGLGGFLLLFMPEHGFTPLLGKDRASWQQMAHTLRGGMQMMQRRPALFTILSIIAIYGAFSEGFDRLWTPHLLDNFTLPALGQFQPVVWFGIIRAGGTLLTVAVTEIARRRVDTNSHQSVAQALFAINSLLIAGVAAFGLANGFVIAFVVLLAVNPLRAMNAPIQTAWVNQRLDSNVRATVISMSSQADALGQIIGGPILGAIATALTTRVEMVAAAIVLSPVLLLYGWTMRGTSQQQADAVQP
jgi:DHA3 family tetracycline resistance protein-like MFS transporter